MYDPNAKSDLPAKAGINLFGQLETPDPKPKPKTSKKKGKITKVQTELGNRVKPISRDMAVTRSDGKEVQPYADIDLMQKLEVHYGSNGTKSITTYTTISPLGIQQLRSRSCGVSPMALLDKPRKLIRKMERAKLRFKDC